MKLSGILKFTPIHLIERALLVFHSRKLAQIMNVKPYPLGPVGYFAVGNKTFHIGVDFEGVYVVIKRGRKTIKKRMNHRRLQRFVESKGEHE